MTDDARVDADAAQAMRAAGERRIALKQTVSRVEVAAARAAAEPGWAANLALELEDLRTALDQHAVEVEGPDGLLNELAEDAPRLVPKIDMLRDEHPVLLEQASAAITAVADREPDDARAIVLDLLVAIARHRQKGSDLVYDAYNVDLGGG